MQPGRVQRPRVRNTVYAPGLLALVIKDPAHFLDDFGMLRDEVPGVSRVFSHFIQLVLGGAAFFRLGILLDKLPLAAAYGEGPVGRDQDDVIAVGDPRLSRPQVQ